MCKRCFLPKGQPCDQVKVEASHALGSFQLVNLWLPLCRSGVVLGRWLVGYPWRWCYTKVRLPFYLAVWCTWGALAPFQVGMSYGRWLIGLMSPNICSLHHYTLFNIWLELHICFIYWNMDMEIYLVQMLIKTTYVEWEKNEWIWSSKNGCVNLNIMDNVVVVRPSL